jgi:hypothetical protein
MRKVRLCRVFFRVGPSTREILPFLPIVPDGMEYCGFLMYVGQDHHGIQLGCPTNTPLCGQRLMKLMTELLKLETT